MKRKHNFKDRTGERYLNNENCWMTIIEYFSAQNCDIQFDDGTILKNRQFGDIKRGRTTNPNYLSAFGVGYIGIGKYKSKIDRKYNKAHKLWSGMFERCYGTNNEIDNPSYVYCKVADIWHNFQNFAEWFENNYIDGFHLDKDILIKGNKIYSPDTCAFVPQEINTLFTSCKSVRGKYPIGVTKKGNKYEARVSKNEDRESQGLFNTPEEAFQAYKLAKEAYIKEIADKWRGQITEECYEAMYNYKVEITD